MSYKICYPGKIIAYNNIAYFLLKLTHSGSLKHSTVEQAIQKVTASSPNPTTLSLNQFITFIDTIQSNVNFEEIDVDAVVESVNNVTPSTALPFSMGLQSSKVRNTPVKRC